MTQVCVREGRGEGGGVVCKGGGAGGLLRQYFGYNYLEIMRLADLTAGPLSSGQERKKQKSIQNTKQD